MGQGRENCKTFLRNNPDLATRVEDLIKEKLSPEMLLSTKTAKGDD
jgi:hypothetical protein